MQYDNIDFHNVEEMVRVDHLDGLRLQRVPETVREKVGERGQMMLMSPVANVEMRFFLLSDEIEVKLSTMGEGHLGLTVFWGDFGERGTYEITPEVKSIKLKMSERLGQLDGKYYEKSDFNPRVVRLMFSGGPGAQLMYHGIGGGQWRLPNEGEVPAETLLCYGTSITHGGNASRPHITYPYITAKNLGMDLINLGMSGACLCEKEMVDFIASKDDWAMATFSVSVNMYNSAFCLQSFKEHIEYLVNTVANAHPSKPIFCITLYTFFDDVEVYNDGSSKNAEEYRQALRDLVHESGHKNVYLVEGRDILTDFTLLSPDLIHPNDLGMVQMGNHLAQAIKSTVL